LPVIAFYCGRKPSLVEEGKTGHMYRYEEIEMLAHTIMRLFEQKDFALLSFNQRKTALARHDREINASRLVEIYTQIVNS
jgi:glycosyltransferase involved in cell wall biosynthesis